MARQRDMEPLPAFLASLASMGEAARYTGAGARTAGRRASAAGTVLGRQAWAAVADSGRRATVALRVYRGEEVASRRRPGEYVAMGAFAGLSGAFAVAALGRAILRRPDGGPGASQARQRLAAARVATAGPGRSGPEPAAGSGKPVPVPATGEDAPGAERSVVTAIARPVQGDATHRHRRGARVG